MKTEFSVILTIFFPTNVKDYICQTIQKFYFFGVPGELCRLSVQLLILAQVMITWFLRSSPVLGSPSFCPSPAGAHAHTHTLFLKQTNKQTTKNNKKRYFTSLYFLIHIFWCIIPAQPLLQTRKHQHVQLYGINFQDY